VEAFGVELEVMDQRFHRLLHLGAARRRVLDFSGITGPGVCFSSFDALLHDLRRLAHFLMRQR
jgi:hypothetical protein